MSQICRHLFTAGHACPQPAIKGRLYCRHHVVIKRTLAQVKPEPSRDGAWTPLPLVYPEDRAALQLNYAVVLQAFNDRRLSPRIADVYLRILRGCATNLKAGPLANSDNDNAVERVILTPEGEEVSPARVDAPSWATFAQPAADDPDALVARHHPNCECGLCPAFEVPAISPGPFSPGAVSTGTVSTDTVSAAADTVAAPGPNPKAEPKAEPQPAGHADQLREGPEWERRKAQAALVAGLAPWDKNDRNSSYYRNSLVPSETKK